jgi:DNA-binding transcriptional ArsR family regulator
MTNAIDPTAAGPAYELHAAICSVLIDALRTGERSVTELAESVGCSLANASQHLAVMRAAGLVGTRRIGRTVLYELAEPDLVEACDVIHRIVDRRLSGGSPDPVTPSPAAIAPTR